MNATYQIVGTDGQVYGPVSLGDLKAWIGEGRVDANTQVLRSDQSAWQPASSYTELELPSAPAAPPAAVPVVRPVTAGGGAATPATPAAPAPAALLAQQVKNGASWFYWIAGLSLINTVVQSFGGSMSFIFGLGITQVIDAIAGQIGPAGRGVALALDAVVFGLFILVGVLANRRKTAAFIAGMVLYALDSVLFLVIFDLLPLAFHAFALFFIFKGFQACRALNREPVQS